MFDVSEGLKELIISGHDMQDKISFGDFIVGFIFSEEVVLFEGSEGSILVPASDDLSLCFHYE